MAGAYYRLLNCIIQTSPMRATGSDQYCPDAPSVFASYPIYEWNRLFSSCSVPIPQGCPQGSGVPVPGSPGSGPTSGGTPPAEGESIPKSENPPPPPPESDCGPAMGQFTDSMADQLGYKGEDGLKIPLVGSIFSLPVFASATAVASDDPNVSSRPAYKRSPRLVMNDDGQVESWIPGEADGYIVFAPPEFEPWDAYGEDDLPGSQYPSDPGQTTVLLLNADRTDGGDTDIQTVFAFGEASKTSRYPKNGIYFEYDPGTGVLAIQHTDASGNDANVANGVTIDGVAVGGGSGVTFPIEAPDDQAAPQYSFDADTVTGADSAGMGFDQDTKEGPKLQDIAGDAQLIITTAGVTIPNKLTVDGLIDPTGLEFTPVAANPGGTAANTIWINSATNALSWGSDTLATTAHVLANYQPLAGDLTNIVSNWTIDASGNASGIGTLASGAHTVTQATLGNAVATERSTATNDDPIETRYHGRQTTTEDKLVNLFSFNPASDKRYTLEATVTVRQISGTGVGTGRTIKLFADIQNISGSVTVTNAPNIEAGTLAVSSCTVSTGLGTVTIDLTVEGVSGSGKAYLAHAKVSVFGPVGT